MAGSARLGRCQGNRASMIKALSRDLWLGLVILIDWALRRGEFEFKPTAGSIRPLADMMTDLDLPEVARLDQELSRYPWSVDRHRRARSVGKCRGMVVRIEAELVGFVVYQPIAGGYLIHKLFVAEAHRRNGIGTRLLQRVREKARELALPGDLPRVFTHVPERCLAGQLFLKRNGWLCTAIYENFRENDGESWYIFWPRDVHEELEAKTRS